MSTAPTENPGPGFVTFTALGNAALDQLAASLAASLAPSLAAECGGSPTSIADLLERVLEADVEDLAESLSEATHPPLRGSRPGRDVEEVGPAAESPDSGPPSSHGLTEHRRRKAAIAEGRAPVRR